MESEGGRTMRRYFSAELLVRLREMPSDTALALIAATVKADPAYRPVQDVGTRRWHAFTSRGDFEILTTGTKWYDTRERRGGGGAIDLAMHMLGLSFVEAVRHLTTLCVHHGHDHS